jgi:tripartite-type tricarboxylate transporter receptor subunit TctC
VPQERVQLLRRALAAAVSDREFLNDMAKNKLPVSYRNGDELQAYVVNALNTPASVVKEFANLMIPK